MMRALQKSQPVEQPQLALDLFEVERDAINVFIRNDDVDDGDPSLHGLLHLFLELEIPINLQIIPERLTDAGIMLLRQYQNYRPDLFELNQHGWRHVNHEPAGRKCEFGASRSFEEQLVDIARGRDMLEHAFGKAFSPVFTPPWNRCTQDTYRALDQLSFLALSKLRGKESVTGYGFRELSVTLDLFRWKGGAAMKPVSEFVSELRVQLRELDTVGIMLHHKVMDDTALMLLRMVLNELRRSDAVRFHTFQSLLKS